MEKILKNFINLHYKEINPRLGKLTGKKVYEISEGSSTIITNETRNGLEFICMNICKENFNIKQEKDVLIAHNYESLKKDDFMFYGTLIENENLTKKYRTITPNIVFATAFGEPEKLDQEEYKFYLEYIGQNLPVNILIKKYFQTQNKNSFLLDFWKDNPKIKVHTKFRNGPLHYFFRDNAKQIVK